jgi:hypothetical protein
LAMRGRAVWPLVKKGLSKLDKSWPPGVREGGLPRHTSRKDHFGWNALPAAACRVRFGQALAANDLVF